ncbi:signal recognition particle protein [Buchnera aphidicola (Thelaxes californica)]|uniref:signal-recognition-particle GTPase n=1 Tax=Buchnera aphidicola (Thelaxes californica) TaxID=1315998 RepID=A0A4D6YJS9_9GAMM|nr:signal recognition particle protein [Buchnera aphidicola]QCI26831.1 signal recognition particle protein [Buchnera aphidicola (Thelaxes californica)]
MFNTLTEHLNKILNKISNTGRLTEQNIQNTLREVRTALLEADVSLEVIKNFIEKVKLQSIGKKFNKELTPGQELIKVVKQELINCMKNTNEHLNFSTIPPAIILMVGLQGMGKTTTTAKLGKYIQKNKKKKVLLVSLDIHRPAAIEQLKVLSEQIQVDFFSPLTIHNPLQIAQDALSYVKNKMYEVIIFDTAGRLHVNENMMKELNQIYNSISPIETLLTIDAMIGQDAHNIINQFSKNINITGIVITKIDGNARAGVALSIKEMTGKPIKFMGIGEKVDDIEAFNPEKIANRILGMGDTISIIEEIERKITKKQSHNLKKKINSGKKFTLNDFLIHITEINKSGGIVNLINRLPQNDVLKNQSPNSMNNNILKKFSAIIQSMNHTEKMDPDIIKSSRKKRIALGSGTKVQDINIMLKQFLYLQNIMKKVKTGNIKSIFENIKNIFSGKR